MRILIPIDNNGWFVANPFTSLLPESLTLNGACVSTGRYWLKSNLENFDILNLQWPEHTLPEGLPFIEAVNQLCAVLTRFRQKGAVIATVHNDLPHKNRSTHARYLYESVYDRCDGFVHMGNESKHIMLKNFPKQTLGKSHIVIPHGNYSVFGERRNRLIEKESLGLVDRPTALLIGSLRNSQELLLSYRLMRAVLASGGQVLFAARLVIGNPGVSRFSQLSVRILREVMSSLARGALKLSDQVVVVETPVPSSKMSNIVGAADVLLIPRIHILNSGNVQLGFTYGSVVVGPNVGNVGEILRENGNPVFSSGDSSDKLRKVISEAFKLAHQNLGEANYKVAQDDWAWRKLGQSYIEFFESILAAKSKSSAL